jgi:tRNA G18 (ribose-2'-O)-methylase SpoU
MIFSMDDPRNLVDGYKTMSDEFIREDLRRRSFPYAVLMQNFEKDFNIGTLIRNSNAFGARDIFYLSSSKHIDRRGAVGSYKYKSVNYLRTLNDVAALKQIYTFVAVEQTDKSVPLHQFSWPRDKQILLIFGEESCGVLKEILDICDYFVEVSQYGSIRSLNVGTCSGIVMNDLVQKAYAK